MPLKGGFLLTEILCYKLRPYRSLNLNNLISQTHEKNITNLPCNNNLCGLPKAARASAGNK